MFILEELPELRRAASSLYAAAWHCEAMASNLI